MDISDLKKLKKVERYVEELGEMEELVTIGEFTMAFNTLVETLKKGIDQLTERLDSSENELNTTASKQDELNSEVEAKLKEVENYRKIIDSYDKKLTQFLDKQSKVITAIDQKLSIRQEQAIGELQSFVIEEIEKNKPAIDPDEINDNIELIRVSIKKLDERVKSTSSTKVGWGAHPLVVKSNGTTIDKVTRILNFTSSTVTRNPDGTVNISGGGGLTEIEISGTVDDNNTTFTAPSEPRYLVVNGVWYKASGGAITWSYNAGTITLDKPIGTGGQIWGFGS